MAGQACIDPSHRSGEEERELSPTDNANLAPAIGGGFVVPGPQCETPLPSSLGSGERGKQFRRKLQRVYYTRKALLLGVIPGYSVVSEK
jgi:hypothetical protein